MKTPATSPSSLLKPSITQKPATTRSSRSGSTTRNLTQSRKPTFSTTPRKPSSSTGTRLSSRSSSFSKPAPSTRLKRPAAKIPGTTFSSKPSTKPFSNLRSSRLSSANKPVRTLTPRSGSTHHSKPRSSSRFSAPNKMPTLALRNNHRHPGSRSSSPRYSTFKNHHPSPSYYNRNKHGKHGGHHGGYYGGYHNKKHHKHCHYSSPYYRHRYYNACRPVWCGPVVYPASGFGFTWWDNNFAISFSSYSPVRYNYHTPYYNSWYYGGCGYSSVYYGGWRRGWYGGLSYVCNPWPVYRTYYLYEPEPIVIEQPVVIRQEVIVEQEPAPVTETTVIQAAPISYASGYPSDYMVVEERTTISQVTDTEDFNAAEFDPEYIYEDQFDPFYYDGEMLDEELQIGFSSYASSLNPESIWLSYAQLDVMY